MLSALGVDVASGSVVGVLMGYGLKKFVHILKIVAAAIIGFQLLLLAALETQGYIDVNWMDLNSALASTLYAGASHGGEALGEATDMFGTVYSIIPAVGGIALGFAVGWRAG